MGNDNCKMIMMTIAYPPARHAARTRASRVGSYRYTPATVRAEDRASGNLSSFFLSIGVQSTFAIIILLLHPLFRVTQVLIVDFGESRALLLDFLDDLLIAYCTRILIPGSYLACLPCLYPSNFDFDFELETQTGGSSAAEPS